MEQSELDRIISTGIHTTARCNVVSDLQDLFRSYVDGGTDWAFRGQPGAYQNLVPSLARSFPGGQSEAALGAEKRMLRNFRRSNQQLLARADNIVKVEHIQEGHDLRCLSVMQHYEVPTRLLDWTTNFWIALYFACSSNLKGDAELWAYLRMFFLQQREEDSSLQAFMDQSDDPQVEPAFLSRSDNLLIEFAPGNSSRMKAQSAHHTAGSTVLSDHVQLFIKMRNQLVRRSPNRRNTILLRRTVIDSACKTNVLRYLDEEHQINASSIYPDIVGLTRQLRWDLDTYLGQVL